MAGKRLGHGPAGDFQIPSADLDVFVEELRGRSGVPGVSVAFLKQGDLVWHRQFGYADRAGRVPLTGDVLMQGASLTKPTFACAFLRLCEERLCDLDKPVAEVMPDFPIAADPRAAAITPRQLLSHTSGLPLTHSPEWPLYLEASPGGVFSYSGAGYICLQRLAEFRARKPLTRIMRKYVVEPLGWKRSCYTTSGASGRVSQGYDWDGSVVQPPGHYDKANAAASLHTTALEYVEFIKRVLLPDHYGVAGILRPETAKTMAAPHVNVAGGIAWGLGWGIHSTEGSDRLFHWADSRGFMHYATIDQRNATALVVLTNGRHGLRLCEEVTARTMGEGERSVFDWIYRGFYEAGGTPIPPWPR
ncbi:MAG: serine hydrolase [Candidatus Hydrogenedentes bacterium]|nr:serine hydrolase [Candidatus Hydrogenedentota bacterium]